MNKPKRWRVHFTSKHAIVETKVVSVVTWASTQDQATERALRKLGIMVSWGVVLPIPIDELMPYKWELT